VVITACGSLDSAIAAIRAGACDFVTKPSAAQARGIGRKTLCRKLDQHGVI